MTRLIRSAYVIARRDFAATVLSKAFLFFLLGPLFPLLLGGIFGGIGARVASESTKPVVAVVSSPGEFSRLSVARDRFAEALPNAVVVQLVHIPPEPDLAAQRKRLLASTDRPVRAVLTGGLDRPHLTGSIQPDGTIAGQVNLFLADARAPQEAASRAVVIPTGPSTASLTRDRAVTAQIGQMVLFFLTILLSGMLLSQLIEEKSNKIIEVIAAAVPIDALFIGKLFAMLAASVIGIVLWTSAGAALIASLKEGGLAALPSPAVGWTAYIGLAIVYFAMNYLLLGSLFLTIGAQASTVREVQTLSMPITFAQVVIFGFAAAAVGAPGSGIALGGVVFPLSSPLVMVARAAEAPELWPHLVAILWQLLWVGLILHLGAKMFRRTVLKSGPGTRKWWRFSRA